MLSGIWTVDYNLQVAINEACVLERSSPNRGEKDYFLDGSQVLVRDLLLDKIYCIYPHDLWVKTSAGLS